MPLFMDLHKASDYDVKPTVEEIKRNHIADLEVQHKYGVRFLQYWINEEAGLVFCLMEAPDKESCAAVHREAHGAMPCNVIELKGGDYMTYIGEEGRVNEFDIVENADGTLDAGYRVMLVVDSISILEQDLLDEKIDQVIKQSAGRIVNRPGPRKTVIFSSGGPAIECAVSILDSVQNLATNIEVRIGIGAGEPVTEGQDFFGAGIQLANHLCDIAQNRQILISSLAKQLTGEIRYQNQVQGNSLKILNPDDEKFLNQLIDTATHLLSQGGFNIDILTRNLGISRTGLYRRITNLTGISGNNFIQEMRMQKALQLIRNKYGNVTQVAMELGFSNPSYFAKSFQKRYGILPFKVSKLG